MITWPKQAYTLYITWIQQQASSCEEQMPKRTSNHNSNVSVFRAFRSVVYVTLRNIFGCHIKFMRPHLLGKRATFVSRAWIRHLHNKFLRIRETIIRCKNVAASIAGTHWNGIYADAQTNYLSSVLNFTEHI